MWNDKETEIDLLGHDKIAQTVIEIINENHLRPLTIGIYGDWGVGKSSILSQLSAKVKKEKEIGTSNSHCILFNGWLFQGYEDAKSALMETVIKELSDLQTDDEKVKKLAKSLLKRVNWLKVAKISAGAVLTGLTGLPVGGLMNDLMTRTKPLVETSDDEKLLKESDDTETVSSQIHAFRNEFKELIESSKIDHIIVLVDDLDRCLPTSVIEVLEAIRLFLFVEGTTFVISADERMIEYAVREHFPNLPATHTDYTKSYLEKLIQIPIRIPTLNNLQTGNYIRLLMLQNHLKNDSNKLHEVYLVYESKKKRPYDPIEITYEIVSEAIDTAGTDLKETLYVASQITPTLAAGLKGNPRNVKRFLNTLFLRMKIARIYGLDDVVKLNVLAKLMLLERFQPDKFEIIVSEVMNSTDGFCLIVEKINEKDHVDLPTTTNQIQKMESVADQHFASWSVLEPSLKNIDLRPYIYISKEKALSFEKDDSLSPELVSLLELLRSNNEFSLKGATNKLVNLSPGEQTQLFEKLEAESRSAENLKKMPASVNGLLRIIEVNTDMEERFVKLLESYPIPELGVWAISFLGGLNTVNAKARFKKLLQKWAEQNENKILQSFASQNLKKLK